jgi:rhodanese-related sulfurtransferase
MKTRFLFFYLTLLVGLCTVIGGCDYITGAALDKTEATISLPRWGWSVLNDTYPATVIDRNTGQPLKEASPDEAFGIIGTSQYLGNPVIIDVRTPQEYASGHLRDAVNIDYQSPSFKNDIGRYDKDFTYIVYCQSGVRSAAASKVMIELGFKYVINMTGGYADWVAAGLPVNG